MAKASRKQKRDSERAGSKKKTTRESGRTSRKVPDSKKPSTSSEAAKSAQPSPAKKGSAGSAPEAPAQSLARGSTIPKFDLSRQILAEKRKIAAERRKGPGGTSRTSSEAPEPVKAARDANLPDAEVSVPDRIIAEIVSRDIARMCDVENEQA